MTKTIFVLVTILYVISCKPTQQVQLADFKDTIITDVEVTSLIDTLSSDYYEGRGFGTIGIEKAAVYIENYLSALKIKPFFESYRDSFEVRNRIGYNIIGLIEGSDPNLNKEFVILSAHYDHVGKTKNANDSIRNGANDNASGVSAVLNIAKLLSDNKLNKRSVIVALYSGEEIGLTGSEHFADKIADKVTEMYCNINIDMIGSILTEKPEKVYISGEKRSNMREIYNKYIGNEAITSFKSNGFFDIFRLSDNFPIYEKLNIPAHTFCTFDFKNYVHYHKPSDEIQNLDLENTGIIVRNIAKGFVGIVNSSTKEVQLVDEQ